MTLVWHIFCKLKNIYKNHAEDWYFCHFFIIFKKYTEKYELSCCLLCQCCSTSYCWNIVALSWIELNVVLDSYSTLLVRRARDCFMYVFLVYTVYITSSRWFSSLFSPFRKPLVFALDSPPYFCGQSWPPLHLERWPKKAAKSSSFRLRHAAFYLGANSRAQLLLSLRADARTAFRPLPHGWNSRIFMNGRHSHIQF
jgi:hypothetical protein